MAKKNKNVIKITKKDLHKINTSAHRKALKEAGLLQIHKPKVHKDRKSTYTRKPKHPKKGDE